MLSIKPIGSSSNEISYYAELGQEDYYVSGTEPPGKWWGRGAEAFGEVGLVEKQPFASLLKGFHPQSRKPIVQNAGDRARRSAFDLTFTVPKSVSVIWGLADAALRWEIEQAVDRCARRTLDVVQQYCGITRRGVRGERTETAHLAAAMFQHDTARAVGNEAPDPNLHVHCVLLNAVARSDGTTGALDARDLFRPHMKMALGALFRAELATELRSLGFETYRPIKNEKECSWFEVIGVSDEMIRAFSKRRGQIEAWLDDRGLTGAKAAEKAANATRSVKRPWRRDELIRHWQVTADTLGFRPEQLRRDDETHAIEVDDRERAASSRRCLADITEHSAHFSKIELVRRLAEKGQTRGYRIGQICADAEQLIRSKELVVRLGQIRQQTRFTTPEMLAIERRMIEMAHHGKQRWNPNFTSRGLAKPSELLRTLSEEQRFAVEHLVTGTDRVACVNGMAGTGKTFMLGVAHRIWSASGFQIMGTALAAKAARGLEEGSRIPSWHIHSLLSQISSGRLQLASNSVLVCDEAGMVGTRMMERLIRLTGEAKSKLVLVGDHRQLQAIEAGGPFHALANELGAVQLTNITRQRDDWARNAVKDFARGEAGRALSEYFRRGQLIIAPTRVDAVRQLVSDWKDDLRNQNRAMIFSATRMETQLINRWCQYELVQLGLIGENYVEVGTERIHEGDDVVFTRNNNQLLVRNGTGGRVVRICPEANSMVVEIDTGYRILVDSLIFPHVSLGYAVTVHKGQGQTVDSAYVLAGGPMTDRELSYVQASRARCKTLIYCDADSAGDDLCRLARQMEISRAKDLALEHVLH